MARNDPFTPNEIQAWPFNTSPISTGISVTPSSSEVSVQTQSIDSGSVVLYDTNNVELDRVSANSSSYVDTSNVGGTTVEGVRLTNAGSTFSAETITINDATGGGGTDSTVDVSSSSAESIAYFDGSSGGTGAAIISGIYANFDAELYIESSSDSGSTWSRVTQLTDDNGNVTFSADWHSQFNRVMINSGSRRISIENVDTLEGLTAIDGDER